MLHAAMAMVTVRVRPRSGRTAVEAGADEIVISVRATPEGGRATEEARRALAGALGLAASRVRLRTGLRSRTKVFEVEGLSVTEVAVCLRAT